MDEKMKSEQYLTDLDDVPLPVGFVLISHTSIPRQSPPALALV
jgi:hypothetical protein